MVEYFFFFYVGETLYARTMTNSVGLPLRWHARVPTKPLRSRGETRPEPWLVSCKIIARNVKVILILYL